MLACTIVLALFLWSFVVKYVTSVRKKNTFLLWIVPKTALDIDCNIFRNFSLLYLSVLS
jgi:hypothetical protein